MADVSTAEFESTTATPESEDPPVSPASPAGDAALVEEDLLVEDVSIDGMCGVY